MRIKRLSIIVLSWILLAACTNEPKLLYNSTLLVLTENSLTDAQGAFTVDDLPEVSPKCNIGLKNNASSITKKMWKIALDDIEQNIIDNDYGSYFAAGRRYTDRVYTRDIAFAGILGLNDLYPEKMKKSLMITREVRGKLAYKVSAEHVIPEIDVPWEVISESEKDVMAQYRTNSYTRRTDDVVWIWAVDHLFNLHPEIADWEWFYNTGKENFKTFYNPWFDAEDGLFKAQPAFQDICSSGYPKGMTIADCVLLKGASTNCLYYKAMLAMASAAEKCNQPSEAENWLYRARKLKTAIKKELVLPDGTVSYYKDRHGKILNKQHNLGTAFTIIFGILDGEEAKQAVENYPTTDRGIPLIHPFFEDNKGTHNAASWPFCSTFFLQAKEIAEGKDYRAYNAALLARTMGTKLADNNKKDWGGFGSFHEIVQLPSGIIFGSGQQLWTSAAYINVCLRANLVELDN